jgi:hypothetical protein
MKHSNFAIGGEFVTASGIWRCTDIGTRTIIAIKISDKNDQSWFNGPPYAVAEIVFDEDDREACWADQAARDAEL